MIKKQNFSASHINLNPKLAKRRMAEKVMKTFLPDQNKKFKEAKKIHKKNLIKWDLEGKNGTRSKLIGSKYLDSFDVEEYLRGLLWIVRMYHDGLAPDYYWKYPKKFAPSSKDIVKWIAENSKMKNKIVIPVSNRPALPSQITCLALLTNKYKELVQSKRLRWVMEPESPVGHMYMQSNEEVNPFKPSVKRDYDLDLLLETLYQYFPEEMDLLKKDGEDIYWTVVQSVSFGSINQSLKETYVPKPPSKLNPHVSGDHVVTLKMPATKISPKRPWIDKKSYYKGRFSYKRPFENRYFEKKYINHQNKRVITKEPMGLQVKRRKF
mmetsp:Transcript_40/g.62  ORF Transcript_40/g.62 Transcript_40/m.62 type:complete len:323 (+) Transcript_40:87-1055(+)